MSVKIRLKRLGKIRAPYYRIVVADSRTKRDGRAIEEIGKYHPTEEPSFIEVDSARAQYWLGVGAQPTEQVLAILKVTGDWQKFKGLPGAEGTLRTAAPRADKKAVFEAAAKETMGAGAEGATTPKSRKKAEPKSGSTSGSTSESTSDTGSAAVSEPTNEPTDDSTNESTDTTPAQAPGQPADAADEGAPGGSETSAQTAGAGETSQAEG